MMDEISKTYIVIEVDDHESSISENVDNALIESIWEDLDGHVDREYIRRAVLEARARYQHATIKTFIPIFTRRYVLNKLHQSRLKDRTRASG
jgi:polyribonucleotide nucleotidyltransferase